MTQRVEVFGRQAITIKTLFPNVHLLALTIDDPDGRTISLDEAEMLLAKGLSEGRLVVRESTEQLINALLDRVTTADHTLDAAAAEIAEAQDIINEERARQVRLAASQFYAARLASGRSDDQAMEDSIEDALKLDVELTRRIGSQNGEEIERLSTGDLPEMQGDDDGNTV